MTFFIFILQCQEAKWALSYSINGFTDDRFTGMSHYDFIENCERKCPDSSSCHHQLHTHDFLNPERCQRNGFHGLF